MNQTELLTCFKNRSAHGVTISSRTVQLETTHARHVVIESANLAARDRKITEIEEFNRREFAFVNCLDQVESIGALNLVAVDHPAALVVHGALVTSDLHIVVADDGIVFNPVRHRGTTHDADLVFGVAEEDRITNHMAVVITGHDLLGLVRAKILKRVYCYIGQETHHIWTFEINVLHVEGLIEEDDGV